MRDDDLKKPARNEKMIKNDSGKKSGRVHLTLPFLYALIIIMPLFSLIIWSFTQSWPWPFAFPQSLGLRGWRYFFDESSRSLSILSLSLCLACCVAFLSILISIPAARALAFYRFKGRKYIELMIFIPVIVSPAAVAMGVHMQFIKWGIANTFFAVMLIHMVFCIPYSVRLLKNAFEITGEEMELQARVLGANTWQVFSHITFPSLLPALVSSFGLTFIISMSQYFITYLIGGGRIVTFSMLMFPYIQNADRIMGSVYSLVFIMVTLIFLSIAEKMMNRIYKDKIKENFYV